MVEANSRLRNAVGLAMKAGKVQSGDFVAEKLVRGGEACLVLLDAAAAHNTQDKYARMCSVAQVTWIPMPDLGWAIGKPGRMVAAVTDKNFSDMIRRAAEAAAAEKATRG